MFDSDEDGGEESVERGCGTRRPGLYLETASSPRGKPIEYFLLDPPQLLPEGVDGLHLANKTQVIEDEAHSGLFHVLRWIGAGNYPYVSDIIEEIRFFGGSFRIPLNFDVSKLTWGSRIVLAHPFCYNTAWQDQGMPEVCEKKIPYHSWRDIVLPDDVPAGPCLFKCYDLLPAEVGEQVSSANNIYLRHIGSTSYGYSPKGESAKGLRPAFFARLPFGQLAFINGQMNEGEQRQMERAKEHARAASVPYRSLRLVQTSQGQREVPDDDRDGEEQGD